MANSETGLIQEETKEIHRIPVLPLRDVVVYPHMVIPLFVGREKSIRALDVAMSGDKQIMLAAQTSAEVDEPSTDDIHKIGTLASILQLLKLPDGTIKVLVEGSRRATLEELHDEDQGAYFSADITLLDEPEDLPEKEAAVLIRSVTNLFNQYVKLNKKLPSEVLTSLSGIDEPSRLADTIAAHLSLKVDEKQEILEIIDPRKRLEHLMQLMDAELDLLQVEKRIRGRVKQQMEKSQREYYLNEQMKAIQKELGEMEDAPNEIDELTSKIESVGLSKEAYKKASSELAKLKMMSPMSAEATVVRIILIPWLTFLGSLEAN